MALIDVSELLHDPDFCDSMTHVRRQPIVSALGENTLEEVATCTVGSVQPATPEVIQRLPESLRVGNIQSFWIQGSIRAGFNGNYPDILIFNDKRYAVQHVFDWTHFGSGWSEGTCVQEDLA